MFKEMDNIVNKFYKECDEFIEEQKEKKKEKGFKDIYVDGEYFGDDFNGAIEKIVEEFMKKGKI